MIYNFVNYIHMTELRFNLISFEIFEQMEYIVKLLIMSGEAKHVEASSKSLSLQSFLSPWFYPVHSFQRYTLEIFVILYHRIKIYVIDISLIGQLISVPDISVVRELTLPNILLKISSFFLDGSPKERFIYKFWVDDFNDIKLKNLFVTIQ